ncbi:MAG: hypothetical protein ACHQFZ_03905 [Acidimicrobiales bacterium]
MIIVIAFLAALTTTLPATSGASTTTTTVFNPTLHKASLLHVIDAIPHVGKTNHFSIYPAKIDPTWVYFIVETPFLVNGSVEEDSAQGVAHWVMGRWLLVLGPGSGFCLYPKALAKIPKKILKSLPPIC